MTNKDRGYTLVEMMVVLAITGAAVIGLSQLFSTMTIGGGGMNQKGMATDMLNLLLSQTNFAISRRTVVPSPNPPTTTPPTYSGAIIPIGTGLLATNPAPALQDDSSACRCNDLAVVEANPALGSNYYQQIDIYTVCEIPDSFSSSGLGLGLSYLPALIPSMGTGTPSPSLSCSGFPNTPALLPRVHIRTTPDLTTPTVYSETLFPPQNATAPASFAICFRMCGGTTATQIVIEGAALYATGSQAQPLGFVTQQSSVSLAGSSSTIQLLPP